MDRRKKAEQDGALELTKDELVLEAALHIADRKMRSEKELRDKLKERLKLPLENGEIDEDDIEEAVNTLKESGIINDLNYALEYIEFSELRGRGSQRIREELRRKGVDRYTVEDAFFERERMFSEERGEDMAEEELRRALELAKRTAESAKKASGLDSRKLEEKIVRKLRTQGYAAGIAFNAARKVAKDMAEEDGK